MRTTANLRMTAQEHGAGYEVIGGNHDLEGIDEFLTDEANLEAFMRLHKKPTPHFVRQASARSQIRPVQNAHASGCTRLWLRLHLSGGCV